VIGKEEEPKRKLPVHGMRDKIAPKPLNSVETVARHVQWVKQPYKLRSDSRFLLGARRVQRANHPRTS
jgi:hypothetical protein